MWKNIRQLAIIGVLGLGLAACDQVDERTERARTLADAVQGQLRGDTDPALDQVRPIDRALAGRMKTEADAAVTGERARYVVGAIIAKPRLLEVVQADVPTPVGAPTPDAPMVAKRRSVSRSIAEVTSELPMRDFEPTIPRRALAKSLPQPVARKVRTDMEDALARYGLQGAVVPGTDGEMIVQIATAAPRRVGVQSLPRSLPGETEDAPPPAMEALPRFADSDGVGCPDTVTPQAVQEDPSLATECMVRALKDTGEFAYVEKDFIFEHQFARRPPEAPVQTILPNDPLFGLQWHFKAQGTGTTESAGGAGFAPYWTETRNKGSRDIVVAVVDTGLQMDHPDIAGSPNVVAGFDMVSDARMANDGDGRDRDANDPGDRCDPTNPLQRDSFHGTHVAGVIGAATTDNASGIAGGAWNVTIVPVRALGRCGGRLSDINDAIRWSAGLIPAIDTDGSEVWNENPADIINLSLGLFEPCPASMQDAIDAAVDAGVTVVSAAGNARVSTRFYAPGGCRNVISVAAGDALGEIAPYSNYGSEVDIVAPGGDVTKDTDGDGRPDGILSTKFATDCYDPANGAGVAECFYAYEQGTSMAAPHVSAAAALLLSSQLEAFIQDETCRNEVRAALLADPADGATAVDFACRQDMAQRVQAELLSYVQPRTEMQCSGSCTSYPGTPEIEGQPGMCFRACGVGLLDLGQVTAE